MRRWLNDPLLLKELRTRMRSKAAVTVENLYIVGICAVMFWIYLVKGGFGDALGSEIGSSIFQTVTYYQVLLLLIVGPLIAASAITSEKELKTFDSLCVTPVTVGQIVWAKLAASMAYFFMLILVSLPLACMSFILGGVAPGAILKAYGLTLLYTTVAGSIGLYWSTRFQRSIASIPAASICILVGVGAVSGFGEALGPAAKLISPLAALPALYSGETLPFMGLTLPFWVPCVVLLPMIFACMVAATTIRLRFPQERRYVGLRFLEFLFFLALFGFMVGGILGAKSDSDWASTYQMAQVFGMLLAGFAVLGPWFGASLAVARSDPPGPACGVSFRRMGRALMLKGPAFMAVLILAVAVFLGVGMMVGEPTRVPRHVIWTVYFGVIGFSILAATLLAMRLADRQTRRGRVIGTIVAYVIVAILFIVPVAVTGYLVGSEAVDTPPVGLQIASLLSPALHISQVAERTPFDKALPDLVKMVGKTGPIYLTTGFYALLSLILLVIPSRRRTKG